MTSGNGLSSKNHDGSVSNEKKIHSPNGSSTSTYVSSASSPSSVSTETDSLSPVHEPELVSHDSDLPRRKREKSRDPKKKRKRSDDKSDDSSSSPRKNAKKSAKLAEKGKHNKSTSKLGMKSKQLEKTLDKLHTNAQKKSTSKPTVSNKCSQKSSPISNGHQNDNANNNIEKRISKHFNQSKLTNTSEDNLTNDLLKDCKFSPTFYKKLSQNVSNANGSSVKKSASEPSKLKKRIYEEKWLRNKLGDGTVDEVENYFGMFFIYTLETIQSKLPFF